MSLLDPVLIRWSDRWQGYVLERGRETAYDPETDEPMVFESADEATAWSVQHWAVDPTRTYPEPEPDPTADLPLFELGDSDE